MLHSPPKPMLDHTIYPLRPRVLASTHSLLQSMWDLPIHPFWTSVFASTLLHVHPLSRLSLLAGTSPSPPLADIVLLAFPFGLPLKIFKTCMLGRGFHTLIKNVSFSSPTEVRSHVPFKKPLKIIIKTPVFTGKAAGKRG